jgi:hypothetical protein
MPPTQVAPSLSGDHLPIWVMSVTIDHTRSAGAPISRDTATFPAIGSAFCFVMNDPRDRYF